MFLDVTLALSLELLLEQEDFKAIEILLQTVPQLTADWLSVQWFRVAALQSQNKPESAFKLCETVIKEIPDDRSLLFQLKRALLSFFNGRPINETQLQIDAFITIAERHSNHLYVRTWAYRLAGLSLEMGIELGIFSVTRASTAIAYHSYAGKLLKRAGRLKAYYMTLNKIIALKQKYEWLGLEVTQEYISQCAMQAGRGNQIIQQAELVLYEAQWLFNYGKNQNSQQRLDESKTRFEQAEKLLIQAGHLTGRAKVQELQGALLLDYADDAGLNLMIASAEAYEQGDKLYKAKPVWDRLYNWYINDFQKEKATYAAIKSAGCLARMEVPVAGGVPEVALLKKALDEDDMDAIIRIGNAVGAMADWITPNIFQVLSTALATIGRIDEAIDFSSKAVKALLPSVPHPSLAHAHVFLADQYSRKGAFEKSHEHLEQAALNYRLLDSNVGLGTVMRRRIEYINQQTARTRSRQPISKNFVDELDQIISILESKPNQQNCQLLGGIFQALAQTSTLSGLYQDAVNHYEKAEKLYADHHLLSDLANLWPHFTLFLIEIARKEQSVALYDQALYYSSKAILHLPKGQKQVLFRVYFHQGLCYYESGRLVAGDDQEDRYRKADESFEEAAALIEQSLSLLDNTSITARQEAIAAYLADKQEVYEQAFILNYIFRYDHLRALRWAHPQKMQSVLLELEHELPEIGSSQIRASKKFSYPDFQMALLEREKNMGGRKIVVCEYYCIQENVYQFIMRSDWNSPNVERVPLKVSEIRERQDAFMADNRLIRDTATGNRKRWWQAIKPLVRMAENCSNPGDIIYLMPHGALQNLPLHTLEISDGKALIDRNPIMWSPSASILYQLWQRNNINDKLTRSYSVMGDTRGNLPWAKTEVEELSLLFGTTAVTGPAATKAYFLEKLANTSLLHFSGHGRFQSDKGTNSYLEFPGTERLSPADVMEIKMRPGTTVVLSGCETGVNQIQAGGELMGLSRGFLLAGVDSLILSLWPISDRATLVFFKMYYGYFFTRKHDKACALWYTVRDMKLQGYSFFDWGAFMINGDF